MYRKLMYLVIFALLIALVNSANAELVGHWRFDEGSGEAVNDSSGNGNNGTLIDSVQWDTGQIGGALRFDGTPGYVLIPNPGDLTLINQGDFTITMWFKQDVVEGIANLLQQTDVNGTGRTLLLADAADGIRAYLGGTSTLSGIIEEAGLWYHVAMIVTEGGTADTIEFYINGEPAGTPAQVNSEDCEGDYLIGTNKTLNGRWINGLVDDMRFYNHALSEAEILAAMGGADSYPYALGPDPADGVMIEDTWANLSWSPGDSAVSHDVYIGDNFDDVDNGAEGTFQGNQTGTFIVVGFPGFAFPDGLIPGVTYYWRIDEVNDTEPNSPWKGDIWSFSVPPQTAYFPNPADGAESVAVDVQLSWTGGFGSKLHTVYFGESFEEVDNAAGGQSQGSTIYTPGTLKMAKTYYWRVDEFDIAETHKGDIWDFTTEGAVTPLNPANGAVDVTQTPVLTWSPGLGASHEVYFGTDAASLELKASGNLGSESYEPGQLEWDTTYYWRVDEANSANADSPWTGPLWSFTTANFLIIDDMESYNDINEGEEGSNRIYLTWIDGFDNPAANGAVVGNFDPPFAEQTIVHSGNQSMPMAYDNAVGKSEATLTLTSNKDWTVNGVNTLTIWYRGNSSNAAEQMYVALNDSAVVNNDNPDAAQKTSWTQWNIPLQAFTDQGVNLANVTSITLGLNSVTGGTGMMYFDDIRLYAPTP
ncbi:MAG: LamG domain-containing protein [Sedimentisphaerales bacterium]|nr:LamG domain-containing protein [Sedimentisphaerales bacterium]